MSKGQKRSSREIRKPKAEKTLAAAAPTSSGLRMLATLNKPNKKS